MGYVFTFAAGVAAGVALDLIYSSRVIKYVQGLETSIRSYIDSKIK